MQSISEALQNAINAGNPQRVLLVFSSGDEFTNEDIAVSNGVHYSFEFNSETDLTIGMCPSAHITFTMLNDLGQLDDFEFGTFTAYLGAAIYEGTASETVQRTYTEYGRQVTYAFSPLGVFSASRPDIVRKKLIDISANDQMTLFDEDMPSPTALGLTAPYTPLAILQALCSRVGVTLADEEFINAEAVSVAKWPEQFETATMREVVGIIAQTACSNAMFNRNGELELVWFRQTDKMFDEHDYTEFTPTWYQTAQITGLHIRNEDSTTELKLGSAGNVYLIQNNPFLRQSGSA